MQQFKPNLVAITYSLLLNKSIVSPIEKYISVRIEYAACESGFSQFGELCEIHELLYSSFVELISRLLT